MPADPYAQFGGKVADDQSAADPYAAFGGKTADVAPMSAGPGPTKHNDAMGGPPKGMAVPGNGAPAFPESGVMGALFTPVRGAVQAGTGVKRIATEPGMENKVGGAADVVEGVGKMASPYLLPAVASNPVGVGLGLGAGYVAQQGVQKGADALGVPKELGRFAGDVAGILAGTAASRPSPVRAVEDTVSSVGPSAIKARIERVDPTKAMVQAVKPRNTNVGFTESLSRSMPELKATEPELGRPIAGVQDALDAVKLAKQRVWGQYEQAAGPVKAAGIRVDGRPVADAMRASVPSRTRVQDPNIAARIDESAKTYDRLMSIPETEKLLMETNDTLRSYYAKLPPDQRAGTTSNPEIAHTVAEAEALRFQLYRTLDSDAEGAAPAEFKRRYGSLSNLERELWARKNVADRQNPQNLVEQLSNVGAAWKGVKGLAKLSTFNPKYAAQGAVDIGEAVAGRQAAKYAKELNTTDSLIRRAFEQFKGEPGAVQMPGPPPGIDQRTQRQIDAYTVPGQDTPITEQIRRSIQGPREGTQPLFPARKAASALAEQFPPTKLYPAVSPKSAAESASVLSGAPEVPQSFIPSRLSNKSAAESARVLAQSSSVPGSAFDASPRLTNSPTADMPPPYLALPAPQTAEFTQPTILGGRVAPSQPILGRGTGRGAPQVNPEGAGYNQLSWNPPQTPRPLRLGPGEPPQQAPVWAPPTPEAIEQFALRNKISFTEALFRLSGQGMPAPQSGMMPPPGAQR